MLPKIEVQTLNYKIYQNLIESLMLKNFLAKIQIYLPSLKPKIILLLCSYAMRAFRLNENKPIYLVLANVDERKTFFLYEVTIAACLKSLSFQQIFSPKEKKAIYCFTFVSFFYLKRGNLEAASLACITDFVDKIA